MAPHVENGSGLPHVAQLPHRQLWRSQLDGFHQPRSADSHPDDGAVGPGVLVHPLPHRLGAVDRSANGGDVASFVASDNVAGGKQAADALAKAIGGEGEVLVLQGITGSSASRDRGKGFAEGIAACPNIKVVAQQTAGFDRAQGLNVATNLLQAHPNVKAIFAENDEMALGALEALGARAGSDVMVVGFDGTADGLKAVESGRMVATIAQQPGELGAKAVEQAAKLAKGEPVEAEVPVEVVTVAKDNVADFK